MSKLYRGSKDRTGTGGWRVTVDGEPLKPRNDLFNHSPLGFAWGYSGSGPAQLALAILADHTGDDELAVRLHQHFKAEHIATIDDDEWDMSGDLVQGWLEIAKRAYIEEVRYER